MPMSKNVDSMCLVEELSIHKASNIRVRLLKAISVNNVLIMINILRGCNIKMCCVCMHSEVYTHTSHTVCACGEDLVVNGSDQAESYLLFHVGFDFPPRGEEDTSCITTERKCIYLSIYLHRFFIVSCMQTMFLSYLGFTCRILILVFFCFPNSDKSQDIWREDCVA